MRETQVSKGSTQSNARRGRETSRLSARGKAAGIGAMISLLSGRVRPWLYGKLARVEIGGYVVEVPEGLLVC